MLVLLNILFELVKIYMDCRNTFTGIEWERQETITLFTSDGLVQIGGLMVPKRVSSAQVCLRPIFICPLVLIAKDANIGTNLTHYSIYC